MPRLPPWLLRQASLRSPYLAALLPACRDFGSAGNELRWIKEHVDKTRRGPGVAELCRKRGRGVPLQYLLGSQPFGRLDIRCRPGVLIPRPETEAYTCHLVDLIKTGRLLERHGDGGLSIVDFCTGSGCIPLLLFSSLQQSCGGLRVLGVDVAPEAVRLALENLRLNTRLGHIRQPERGQRLCISKGDIFSDSDMQALAGGRCDVLVSNPPYVSQQVWHYGLGQLGYSVRKYEPRLALVPSARLPVPAGWVREDVFYSRLLDIAVLLRPKVMLLEVGDESQARRVVGCFSQHPLAKGSAVELWRDWPSSTPADEEEAQLDITTLSGRSWRVPTRGSGQVRCILFGCRVPFAAC